MSTLAIDVNKLVQECAEQASEYADAGQAYIEALHLTKAKKAELELHKARLSSAIRKNPSEFGLTKLTEATVSETVVVNETTVILVKELVDLERASGEASVLRDAWAQRSSMLKAEVDLNTSSWFGTDHDTPTQRYTAAVERKVRAVRAEKSVSVEGGEGGEGGMDDE